MKEITLQLLEGFESSTTLATFNGEKKLVMTTIIEDDEVSTFFEVWDNNQMIASILELKKAIKLYNRI